jgi:hypothetical protein
MALDLIRVRQKLLARPEELLAEDRLSAADRSPVALDQDSVGRLSRIDAMQAQAMALWPKSAGDNAADHLSSTIGDAPKMITGSCEQVASDTCSRYWPHRKLSPPAQSDPPPSMAATNLRSRRP